MIFNLQNKRFSPLLYNLSPMLHCWNHPNPHLMIWTLITSLPSNNLINLLSQKLHKKLHQKAHKKCHKKCTTNCTTAQLTAQHHTTPKTASKNHFMVEAGNKRGKNMHCKYFSLKPISTNSYYYQFIPIAGLFDFSRQKGQPWILASLCVSD